MLVIRNLISFIKVPEGNERVTALRVKKHRKKQATRGDWGWKSSRKTGEGKGAGGVHARLQFNQSVPEVVCTSRQRSLFDRVAFVQ